MQVLKVKELEKFDIFEKDFQKYFLLSKTISTAKKTEKYIVLKAKNIITDEIEKFSFGFEDYVKTSKVKKQVLRYLYAKGDELIFFNQLNLKEIMIKKYAFKELMPFLLENTPYEFYIYDDKVYYVKPATIFMDVKLSLFDKNMIKKEKIVYENALNLGQDNIKLDTRKYFY